MLRNIINKIAKDIAVLEQSSKVQKDAFTKGYNLYKIIMANQGSKQSASEEDIRRAMDLLEQGKHVPEAGGEKGAYRHYRNNLRDVLECKKSPEESGRKTV